MDENVVWENEKGTFLRVQVKPNATDRDLIAEFSESLLVVNLKGPAREGRANTELVKRLAKALNTSTSNIAIISGLKSREKILRIWGIDAASLFQMISMLHKR
ncbi:MAG: DUF167 domain-containing protein [Candidatus Thorarchaeota archaeon]